MGGDSIEERIENGELHGDTLTEVLIAYANLMRKQENCGHVHAKVLTKRYDTKTALLYCPDCKCFYETCLTEAEISAMEKYTS